MGIIQINDELHEILRKEAYYSRENICDIVNAIVGKHYNIDIPLSVKQKRKIESERNKRALAELLERMKS